MTVLRPIDPAPPPTLHAHRRAESARSSHIPRTAWVSPSATRAFSLCTVLALVFVAWGCDDAGDPSVPASHDPAQVRVDARTSGFGTEDGLTPNVIRVRVLGPDGSDLRFFEGAFSEDPNRAFGPYSVPLPGGPVTDLGIVVEIAHQVDGVRTVIWSGSAGAATLSPGQELTVVVDLLRGPLDRSNLTGISITGLPAEIAVGDTALAGVTLAPAGGEPAGFWGSLDPATAHVDWQGRVVGISVGTARIVAAVGPVADTSEVHVRPLVASVGVTPTDHTFLSLGDSLHFQATVATFAGGTLPGAPIQWSADPTGVVAVSQTGWVTATGPGTAVLRASSHGVSGTSTIVVSQEPTELVLHPEALVMTPDQETLIEARLLDGNGSSIEGVSVSWESSDASVATVMQNGRVTAVAPGVSEVRATTGGFIAVAQVEVVPAAAAMFQLLSGGGQSGLPGVPLGNPIRVRLLDGSGFPIPGATVSWTASDGGSTTPDSSTTDPGGVAETVWTTGAAAGTQTLDAIASGVTFQVVATVGPPPAAAVVISPAGFTFTSLGETRVFDAVVLTAGGDTLQGAPVTWSTLDGGVASVDTTGMVTAIDVGVTNLVATSGNAADTVLVTVTQVPATVLVSPAADTIQVAQTTQLSAAVLDAGGNSIPGAGITWASQAAGIASVTAAGIATGESVGDATIEATSGPASGSTSITVLPPTPATLVIEGGSGQMGPAGLTLTDSLQVRVLSPYGVPVSGAEVTWIAADGGSSATSTSLSDASGIAGTRWTLGPELGSQALHAAIAPDTAGFVATATGASRVFDRTTLQDRVSVVDDPDGDMSFPDGDWTLSLWVLPVDEADGGFRYAFSSAPNAFEHGVNVYQNPDLGMNWTIAVRTPGSGGVMPLGVSATEGDWQHLVVRRSGDTVRMWSNGVEFTDGGLTVTEPVPSTGTTRIGARGDLFTDWFSGNIAQVTRWSSALTPAEIGALAAGTHPLDVNTGSLDWFIPLGRDPEVSVGGTFTLGVTGTQTGGAPPVSPPSSP